MHELKGLRIRHSIRRIVLGILLKTTLKKEPLVMARNNENVTQKRFNKISIGLSSPEVILGNSRGEVLKPETINYQNTQT